MQAGRCGLEHGIESWAKDKAPLRGERETKVEKVAWGHPKVKKCSTHTLRHAPKKSKYQEINVRGENYYFSLKNSLLSIPGGIDKNRGTGFIPLMS